jgi:hypothetical protein
MHVMQVECQGFSQRRDTAAGAVDKDQRGGDKALDQ